jgi:hypothetical protein
MNLKKLFNLSVCILLSTNILLAQAPKGITIDEYQKAKTFIIKDLDNETYAKFDSNHFIAERYEDRKPYFITGDDGMKKRIDLYSLSKKADGQQVGTLIYYTTEKGKLYTACLPNGFADAKVWDAYFTDIHAIDKVEQFFVLKLSYVLSKEFSYQQYKSSLKGKEPNRAEAGTYGNDICFPGDDLVAMADGSSKILKDIEAGDKIVTIDPATKNPTTTTVTKLVSHSAKNYAITTLTLIGATSGVDLHDIHFSVQQVQATPNHPITTKTGTKKLGEVLEGEQVLCQNKQTGKYQTFTVCDKLEKAGGVQPVYNMETTGGSTFLMNGVMVMQKGQEMPKENP